jgi:putative transposase
MRCRLRYVPLECSTRASPASASTCRADAYGARVTERAEEHADGDRADERDRRHRGGFVDPVQGARQRRLKLGPLALDQQQALDHVRDLAGKGALSAGQAHRVGCGRPGGSPSFLGQEVTPFGSGPARAHSLREEDRAMRVSKFTDGQIVAALRQTEAGTPVADICRKPEVTETTFYRWKRKFGDLGVTEVRELKQLREENRKLKTLVAELSLDKTILREALRRKW